MAPQRRPDEKTTTCSYKTREVAKLLSLSPEQTRYYVRAGLVNPERGKRNEYLFSFRQIVILRTAKGLVDSGIPIKKVRRILVNLKKQLPQGYPLTAVQIWADGREVMVRDGSEMWKPESGQAFFNFQVAGLAHEVKSLRESESAGSGEVMAASDWYELGCEQEYDSPELAISSYREALEIEPNHLEANLNLGRIFHERGEFGLAEAYYRAACAVDPKDPTAIYNLGVALEDLRRFDEAAAAYEKALELAPEMKEAHFNLSGVYEVMGRQETALQHLRIYKKLSE